MGPSVDNAAPF